MMDNVWIVKNGNYTATLDVDQLGLLNLSSVKKLLRLSATGEHPEEIDALANKLARALKSARDRVDALTDPKTAARLLGPAAQLWEDQKRKQAEIKRLQTLARRNLVGLKKVLDIYSFKNF